jgi:transposase InsO family protein
MELFNGKLRDECPNVNQFLSIEDARSKTEAWRMDYNHQRPHSLLGNLDRPTTGTTALRLFAAVIGPRSGPISAEIEPKNATV